MKTIDTAVLNEIVERLVDEFDPEQIILFGSHAWGVPHQDSDLDLLIVVNDSNESRIQRDIRAHLCMLDIPIAMDLMVYTLEEFNRYPAAYSSFTAQIAREGKVLYGRGGTDRRPSVTYHGDGRSRSSS